MPSILKYEELDTQYELTCNGCYIHYLEAIQKDLDTRESKFEGEKMTLNWSRPNTSLDNCGKVYYN